MPGAPLEIAGAAYDYQLETDADERMIVGVNGYPDPEEQLRIPILEMDPQGDEQEIARLRHLRAEQDNEKVEQALAVLRHAAEVPENTMPFILDAVPA